MMAPNRTESPSQPSASGSRLSPGIIAGGVIAGIGATCALCFACWISRKKSATVEDHPEDEDDTKKLGILQSIASYFGSPDTKEYERQSPEPANFAPPHWLFARLAGPSGLNQNDVEYVGPMCTVATQYHSTSKDELKLEVGDKVKLKRVYKDGWGLAENLTTESEGILPLSSLEFADFGMFPAFASTALANAVPRRRSVSAIKIVPGYSQSSSAATLADV
ncbi:hypothetical protein M427DRAFT_371374 [Gonapodya prolifera JEL478]|uniref:SH3 domain-containing protein n=1 Tax=Gonapodya prolifera (strain JEL478) TaxID=1344416 RepID=A0A139A9Q7_GONPJ|nr:hypothetical protein M427DRAFT_371374 [Gonapodya prolifera JEL478]|eukprot:KXS13408.1 hypothetical protein M427DRAFT_371374 [Gonapodya prolifera JEL478]